MCATDLAMRHWAIGMLGKVRFSRWLVGAVVLAAVDCAAWLSSKAHSRRPAQAQLRDDRFPFLSRQRPQRSGGGFFGGGGFGGFFGGSSALPKTNTSRLQSTIRERRLRAKSIKSRTGRADDFNCRVGRRHGRLAGLRTGRRICAIRRKSPSFARTSSTPACCATNQKGISTGGMLRATRSVRKRQTTW